MSLHGRDSKRKYDELDDLGADPSLMTMGILAETVSMSAPFPFEMIDERMEVDVTIPTEPLPIVLPPRCEAASALPQRVAMPLSFKERARVAHALTQSPHASWTGKQHVLLDASSQHRVGTFLLGIDRLRRTGVLSEFTIEFDPNLLTQALEQMPVRVVCWDLVKPITIRGLMAAEHLNPTGPLSRMLTRAALLHVVDTGRVETQTHYTVNVRSAVPVSDFTVRVPTGALFVGFVSKSCYRSHCVGALRGDGVYLLRPASGMLFGAGKDGGPANRHTTPLGSTAGTVRCVRDAARRTVAFCVNGVWGAGAAFDDVTAGPLYAVVGLRPGDAVDVEMLEAHVLE